MIVEVGDIIMQQKITNLGLTDNLEDITIDQLIDNEIAINMLLHNYRKLENENNMLKQDLNRQSTIERTLAIKKTYTKIAAIISVFATLLLSFGINFVTTNSKDVKGIILTILGVVAEIISLYFSFNGEEN